MRSFIYALLTLLVCGVRLTDSSAVTAGLFIHYLMGSGQSVTVHSAELLKLCEGEGLYPGSARKVVSSYATNYRWAVGRFTCLTDGTAWDVYDFPYAGMGEKDPIPVCMADYVGINPLDSDLSSMGRCLVRKGYGKPFHVEIKP